MAYTVKKIVSPKAIKPEDKMLVVEFDDLAIVQDGGACNSFMTGTRGTPLYAEGWLAYNEGGLSIKIPGIMHRAGFDTTGNSVDAYVGITDGGKPTEQMYIMVTTNDERIKELGCHGEIALYYRDNLDKGPVTVGEEVTDA